MDNKNTKSGVVYWAHLPEHTDIKTQGYVGFATFFNQRKAKHYHNAKAKTDTNTHFYNALNKYTKNIVWDIIFSGPLEGCVQIEHYFRPLPNTGWNIIPGGSTQTGVNHPRYNKPITEKARISTRSKALERQSTPVTCITTKENFVCLADAARKYGLQRANIRKACKGVITYTGKHPVTGKKLKWEYTQKEYK